MEALKTHIRRMLGLKDEDKDEQIDARIDHYIKEGAVNPFWIARRVKQDLGIK